MNDQDYFATVLHVFNYIVNNSSCSEVFFQYLNKFLDYPRPIDLIITDTSIELVQVKRKRVLFQ